jgi:hypothetical protein
LIGIKVSIQYHGPIGAADYSRWLSKFASGTDRSHKSLPEHFPLTKNEILMIDFLCIGFQKAGTTWMNAALKQHPEIWLPFIKELHYFDVLHLDFPRDLQYRALEIQVEKLRDAGCSSIADSYYEKILDRDVVFTDHWYRHIFSAARQDQIKGETTPYYCCLPREGISHIIQMAPEVKIIILIRDPVERTKSSLKMFLKNNPEKSQLDFLRSPAIIARSNYKENIPRWESCISSTKILYIPFGRIKNKPLELMAGVEKFLGVPGFDGYTGLSTPVNVAEEISIEKDALSLILENSVEQYQFLNQRFGPEFVRETR